MFMDEGQILEEDVFTWEPGSNGVAFPSPELQLWLLVTQKP